MSKEKVFLKKDFQTSIMKSTLKINNFNKTYFFSLFPAPVSLNPLANGLLSIFNWVI